MLWIQICSAVNVSLNYETRSIIVDGKPFFFKGINYLPIPIGYSSWNIDVFSNKKIIDRDIQNLKFLGVNSVRIYHLRLENIESKMYLLNKLYENGIYAVLCRSINNKNWSNPVVRNDILKDWANFVTAFKSHPAVLMWVFGNEMNQPSKWDVPAAFSLLKEIKELTHELEGSENWRPVTTPLMDINIVQYIRAYDDCVDVWSYQIYRGASFYGMINQAAAATRKPLLITEYGIDSYDSTKMSEDQDIHMSVSTKLYLEIFENAKRDRISGGFYFKYSDDWWKLKNATTQDVNGWYARGFPDQTANEEWFGLYSIKPISGEIDQLIPKKMAASFASLNAISNPYLIREKSTASKPTDEEKPPNAASTQDPKESLLDNRPTKSPMQSVSNTLKPESSFTIQPSAAPSRPKTSPSLNLDLNHPYFQILFRPSASPAVRPTRLPSNYPSFASSKVPIPTLQPSELISTVGKSATTKPSISSKSSGLLDNSLSPSSDLKPKNPSIGSVSVPSQNLDMKPKPSTYPSQKFWRTPAPSFKYALNQPYFQVMFRPSASPPGGSLASNYPSLASTKVVIPSSKPSAATSATSKPSPSIPSITGSARP